MVKREWRGQKMRWRGYQLNVWSNEVCKCCVCAVVHVSFTCVWKQKEKSRKILGIKHPQQNDLMSIKLTCQIFSRKIYKIWPENRKTHAWMFYTVDNGSDHILQIAPFISALLSWNCVSPHFVHSKQSLYLLYLESLLQMRGRQCGGWQTWSETGR